MRSTCGCSLYHLGGPCVGALPCASVAALCRCSWSFQDLAQIQDLFHRWDTDRSGRLDAEEVLNFVRALGKDLTDAAFRRLMSSIDVDGDGSVAIDEFVRGFRSGIEMSEVGLATAQPFRSFVFPCVP